MESSNKLNKNYILKFSDKKNKKYMLINSENKTTHFGSKKDGKFMEDFTQTQNEQQKERYIKRHQKKEQQFWNLNIENLQTPSFLSRYLLWNKPTLESSVEQIEKLLNIKIKINL